MAEAAPVSWITSGVTGRCPRCGQGRLFSGFLKVAERCEVCRLSYAGFESGDGPAFFIMFIVGLVVVGGALSLEIIVQPPYWVHAVVWGPLAIVLSLALLRPSKAVLIALQYRHQAEEGRIIEE